MKSFDTSNELFLKVLEYENSKKSKKNLLKELVYDTIELEQKYRFFKNDVYMDMIRDNLLEISNIVDFL